MQLFCERDFTKFWEFIKNDYIRHVNSLKQRPNCDINKISLYVVHSPTIAHFIKLGGA